MTGLLKRYDILFTIAIFLLAIPAEYKETFSLVEDQTLTVRQLLRTTYGDPVQTQFVDDIVLVNTDEEFFEEYKSFPLRRTDIGKIVENLNALGAKVIGLDLLMDFPSSYGEDPTLAKNLRDAGNTLVVSQAVIKNGEFQHMSYPTPVLDEATRSGYSNISSASSIVTSLSRLKVHENITAERDGWPFAVQTVAMYLGEEPLMADGVLKFGDKLSVPLDHAGHIYIDFPNLQGARFLSQIKGLTALEFLDLEELDEDEIEELKYWIEGKIVLVGDTSEVSHDWFDTPVGMVYGVEVIADTVNSILKGAPLQAANGKTEMAIILAIMAFMIGTALMQKPLARIFVAGAAAIVHFAAVTYVYIFDGLIVSMSYVMIAALLSFMIINLRFYLQERAQKGMVKDAFGHFLSPDVVDILVKDPSKMALGGEQREMTAFFSDVAGFSTISEKLTPEELVHLLNEYLTDMCNIVADHGGTIDKFEGDAIIAFWGAPLDVKDHATRACHASIDMQKALITMRENLIAEGRTPLYVRIGLNSGPMVVGNMGSAQRMDYTMMGDSVNLAARLEGANKFYGTYNMISEFTYELAKDDIEVRILDTVRVVGKKEPVTIYELLDYKGKLEGPIVGILEHYNQGLEKYKALDFEGAIPHFEDAIAINDGDGPSEAYIKRCKHFMENPPEADWDGVFTHTEKG